MPYVRGFLRVGRRHRPGRPVDPDYGIPEGERPEISPPDEGEDGDGLEIGGGPIIPNPPPGVWPPIRPEEGWRPVDPGYGHGRPRPPSVGGGPAPQPPQPPQPPAGGIGGRPPERPQPGPGDGGEVVPPIELPPGTIWPPLPEGVDGKFWALVLVGGMPGGPKYRYVLIDASLRPGNRPPGSRPPRPDLPGGGGGHPDQGLPGGGGGHPDQGLPPTAQPRTG